VREQAGGADEHETGGRPERFGHFFPSPSF
jgi:hypothetical protein